MLIDLFADKCRIIDIKCHCSNDKGRIQGFFYFEILPKSWIISVLISIKKFHALFSSEAEVIPFLSKDNLERKYYGEEDITPAMAIVLNQIFHYVDISLQEDILTCRFFDNQLF